MSRLINNLLDQIDGLKAKVSELEANNEKLETQNGEYMDSRFCADERINEILEDVKIIAELGKHSLGCDNLTNRLVKLVKHYGES